MMCAFLFCDPFLQYPKLDFNFNTKCFPKQGAGAKIFIIDTGCRATHQEFRGRVTLRATDSFKDTKGIDDNGKSIATMLLSARVKRCTVLTIDVFDFGPVHFNRSRVCIHSGVTLIFYMLLAGFLPVDRLKVCLG